MRTRVVLTTAAAALLLALTACTHNGARSSGARDAAGPMVGRAGSGTGGSNAAPAAGAGSGRQAGTSTPAVVGPALIRTAELSVRVGDVDAAADRAIVLVTAAGGDVTGDQRDGEAAAAHADLVLSVPTDSLVRVLGRLAALGQSVDRHTSTKDVTATVADVDSRVRSMQATIARLRTLYDRAGSIGDILDVETQLAGREADLESLEAQQRSLRAQTAQASIALHLQPRPAAAAVVARPRPDHSFVAGLRGGWHAFAAGLGWLLVCLGALLPFLVPAAVAGAVIVLVRRRRRPRVLAGGPAVE